MNIYAIYINSTQKNNNFIILEEGFSWIAALFSIFWALYHKMWIVVAITVIANIIATTIIVDFKFIFQIFLILSFGFFAADIRENYLNRNNYQLEDIIIANSRIEAELKFLERSILI
ncbi:DUF2628 domain-containing protein [Rickettsia prowazekii]|uniref:Uncharacterized protein RP318 n=2 Tax=Rickettsia prowazekii TaxID=782 RepID=Y318_RICPR|nr:DUF2628 domain-containing protein [Rickettsia prowazekii]Q9ZDL0.1 RecName: Full=Uncharacterized protein RP318 [Rickettsia prowazekii str. Madrid E]ADE29834.1 hypothetical protein rpr22_CDS312 [Rickettsia prowazekii str. Rp22]AFE49135.1 hypothetical protein M9W_01550 [Rickettsia prowazekii str. Chernikova]AFE49981.1 hypothetical protein M9Y_01555 [Rickettsia prowazekii str. Katsinyian]AFE50825.1 hypothetical protein MA1_01545 [Rickettsia prowazekii str. BuV67-CWPP]AFE51664.1 hypothetical pr